MNAGWDPDQGAGHGWRRSAALAALALVLSACGEPPQGYFPTGEGLNWHYRVSTERRGVVETDYFSVRNIEAHRSGNRTELIRRTSDGTDYVLIEDATGVYRTAKRLIVETAPVPDKAPRYVLRYPLHPGARWVVGSHSYVLHRLHPYEESLRRGTNFDLHYRVVAVDASVEVPAGRFENCVLVEGTGNLTIYSDAVLGWTKIPIETREWYAPDVGLVRLDRTETLDTKVFVGGTRRFELLRFDT